MSTPHVDDEFHPPASDDPYWTETCWFTFTIPERRMSGQFYPFFRPNQGVTSGGCYFWDDRGSQPWNMLYAKNFWHLPIPDQPLSNISLDNGLSYRCTEPLHSYELEYHDDSADGMHAELTFTSVAPPNYLGGSHLDQPGRYVGTVRLGAENIAVDSFGFRDRSWGSRAQFGYGLGGSPAPRGGYSYATSSTEDGWHAITMSFGSTEESANRYGDGCVAIHGYLLRSGEWQKVTAGKRTVIERDPTSGAPMHVRMELEDEAGRTLEAHGRTVNQLAVHLNPNLFTINCLTEWTFDGITCWGEDHDNWSAPAATRFFREFLHNQ